MAAVRYVALLALVFWIGALGSRVIDLQRQWWVVALACGATVIAALLVMKFVGPPPRAFRVRIGLAVVMLMVAVLAGIRAESPALTIADGAIGLILLAWYARE